MTTRMRYIHTKVDEDIYDELANRATGWGMRIDQLLAQFAIEGLENAAQQDTEPNLETRIFRRAQAARKRERVLIHIQQIASAAMESQDEDDFNELQAICQEVGVSVEVVLEKVSQIQRVSSLPSFDSGTGVRSAVNWLQETLDPGERLSSSDIKELGAQRGFTYATLKQAKVHLSIEAIREDKQWYWVMPVRT